jgi:hypothetical protein
LDEDGPIEETNLDEDGPIETEFDEVIDGIGFGFFQLRLLIITGK